MKTKYAIELINQNKDREITFSSLEGSKPVFIEDEEEAIQTGREEASSSYNCSYDMVLVNEYEIDEDEPDEYEYINCIDEFEVEYHHNGSAKFMNISHDELVRDIDDIVGDLEKTYGLDKGEDFFSCRLDLSHATHMLNYFSMILIVPCLKPKDSLSSNSISSARAQSFRSS